MEFISDLLDRPFTDLRQLIRAHDKISELGSVLRTCLRLAIVCYNIWFWFVKSNDDYYIDGCVVRVFFFSRLDFYRARPAFQAVAVIYLYSIIGHFASTIKSFLTVQEMRSQESAMNNSRKPWILFPIRLVVYMWRQYLVSSLADEEEKQLEELRSAILSGDFSYLGSLTLLQY